MRRRLFTLDEATRLLPWLESQFQEMDRHRQAIEHAQLRLGSMHRQSRRNGGSSSSEDTMQKAQAASEKAEQAATAVIQAIVNEGIIVRDPVRGLVDFPSLRDGREVHLCWLRGEPRIGFWHTTDTGFTNRKPL
jgi:hypothetical protein